jgi:hypothetical protein
MPSLDRPSRQRHGSYRLEIKWLDDIPGLAKEYRSNEAAKTVEA